MTTQEILNLDYGDIAKLSRPELAKLTQQLQSTARGRVRTLEKSGLKSTALSQLKRGGKLTTKGKTLNQLRREFKRTAQFLENPQSSVTGVKAGIREINTRLGVNLTQEEQRRLFKIRDMLDETMPRELQRHIVGTNIIQREIARLVKNKKIKSSDIRERMEQLLNEAYEQAVPRDRDIDDFYAEE